jgi:hypothetical protein
VALVSGQEFEPFKLIVTSPGSFQGQFVKAGKGHSTIQTKKQKKGGQSAQRFGRIRQEKRGVWVQKIIESLDDAYLDKDGRPTIKGLVLAGPSTLKQELMACVAGCHSGLLPLLGSAVHLFPTSSIDSVVLQKKALANVQEQMPAFFASAQHVSDEELWSQFLSASERGGAAYGETSVEDALVKCRLRLVLVSSAQQSDNLDKWDAACVEAGALMCVLSSPTTTARLADYGGIVGLPWFSHAPLDQDFEDVSFIFEDEKSGLSESELSDYKLNDAVDIHSSTESPEIKISTPPQDVPLHISRLRVSAPEFVPSFDE